MKNRRLIFLIVAGLILSSAGIGPAYGRLPTDDPGQRSPRTADGFPGSRRLWERVEITLWVGIGLPIMRWTTLHYVQSGPASGLQVAAENKIKTTAAPDVFAGAAATFFLHGRSGLQAGFGYLKSGLTSADHFELRAPGGSPSAYTGDERGTGELTAVPIFICLFNQFEIPLGKKRLQAFLSIGPAVFLNSVLTGTRAGAGAVREETVDGFKIPVAVADATWVSFGLTGGIGLDFRLTASLALDLEARYYHAPRKNFTWTWSPGIYDGVFRNISGFEFDGGSAAAYERNTTPLTVNPAFFQIAGGIKFIF